MHELSSTVCTAAAGRTVQRMTAQEALQRELQELDDGDADAKAIISHSTPSNALYGKPPSRGNMSSGGGWTNASSVANSNAAPAPRVSEGNTYNKAYYNNTFAPQPPPGLRGDARPANVAVNNLMGGEAGWVLDWRTQHDCQTADYADGMSGGRCLGLQ